MIHFLVIQSIQEGGYWSNTDGWGTLESASRYSLECPPPSIPSIGVPDCLLVPLAWARDHRVDV